jgi:hypothetical protein
MKLLTCSRAGLFSWRHSVSPRPVSISSPSESWTEGRQSSTRLRSLGPNRYILVCGATPTWSMSTRGNSVTAVSNTVSSPGEMTKRKAAVALWLSSSAWMVIGSRCGEGAGRSIQ